MLQVNDMLIIANGAPKTGSTWVRHIVANIVSYQDIPDSYANKAWGPIGMKRSIAPKMVSSFLEEADYLSTNYLSKNHFYDKSTYELLTSSENVKIFCITRDLKDVVVSYYYHQIRKKTLSSSFEEYYWKYGRYFVQFMISYQNIWHSNHGSVYVSSYERLKTDFYAECKSIGRFLNVDLSDEQISAIKEDTSMSSMRKKWGEEEKKDVKFFRKGEIGDWENHFTENILADFNKITDNGLSGINYLKYLVLYPIRLKLLHTYQHLYYSIKG